MGITASLAQDLCFSHYVVTYLILEMVWEAHPLLTVFLDFFPAADYAFPCRHAFVSMDQWMDH